MARIRFEKIEKHFKEVTAVRELNLTIEDGEFFTFVGPSGCGKSTILHLIAGLEEVSGGKLFFDDTPVNDLSPKERDVAMVFQSYALYPHLSVYENIAFPLKMRKQKKSFIAQEVKRVAVLLGLEDLLPRKPSELSGGQRQRVALGRAIIRKPRVFLMDEPLSNLDARLRIEMRDELKRLHQELKITTVYVTHDQAEALSLSDRIAVMHKGSIEQCGSPQEIYTRPVNIFVAGFIGSPPMNIIPATVTNRAPFEVDCNGYLLNPHLEKTPVGNRVLIGLRPEDLTVSKERSEGDVEVGVFLVEPAGSFNWVGVIWKGVHLRGFSRGGFTVQAGTKAFMKCKQENLSVFDEETRERL